MSVAGVPPPRGYRRNLAPGRYFFVERKFEVQVRKGDPRTEGLGQKDWPYVEAVIKWYVRKVAAPTRADLLDVCCPAGSTAPCRGLLTDARVEKEYWLDGVQQELRGVFVQTLAFTVHNSKDEDEEKDVAPVYTLRVRLGGVPGKTNTGEQSKHHFLRTILAYVFNQGPSFRAEYPGGSGTWAHYLKFRKGWEGDHLYAAGAGGWQVPCQG
jgi:hypothetical protein